MPRVHAASGKRGVPRLTPMTAAKAAASAITRNVLNCRVKSNYVRSWPLGHVLAAIVAACSSPRRRRYAPGVPSDCPMVVIPGRHRQQRRSLRRTADRTPLARRTAPGHRRGDHRRHRGDSGPRPDYERSCDAAAPIAEYTLIVDPGRLGGNAAHINLIGIHARTMPPFSIPVQNLDLKGCCRGLVDT
jgi:hypothetical protein